MQPWTENPYALITWWDMHRFLGEALGETLLLLGKISGTSRVLMGLKAEVSVSIENRNDFAKVTLPHIQRLLANMDLPVSLAYTDRIKRQLLGADPISGSEMDHLVTQLQERIQDELRNELVLHVPKERAYFYQEQPLFGPAVQSAFHSATFDIEEAGKCLALARSTACVMHLSRAMEVALRALARELNLPARNDWGRHVDDIEKELIRRYKSAGARTPDELFFSESVAQIDHVKTAWRNPTMHVDRVYTEEMAHDILLAIKALMRHLATRLHE